MKHRAQHAPPREVSQQRWSIGVRPRCLFLSVALVILLAGLAAQAPQTVSDRVRDAMLAQHSDWQLESSVTRAQSFSQRWVHFEERVRIVYDERETEAEAVAWFNDRAVTISAGPGVPISGVGDQAQMLSGFIEDGTATIHLRKGKGTATVTVPGEILATQVAQLVAAQIY